MLLVRSICTRVSGRAPFLLLPRKVFAGGGSSMALLSKLRRERGDGERRVDGEAGSAEAAGCFLLLTLPPLLSRREQWEGEKRAEGR